jgi:hypothetical protein
VPGFLQFRVERGISAPALIAYLRELGPSIPQVTINALSIRQVECDSPKHLFQVQGGEGIDYAFRRFAAQKGIHHGVKRNPASD